MRERVFSRRGRAAALAVVVPALVLVAPTNAPADELSDLREQRKQVQAEAAEQAAVVNGLSAEINDVEIALRTLTVSVNALELSVTEAQIALDAAQTELSAAETARAETIAAIGVLQNELGARAIQSFQSFGERTESVLTGSDPIDIVRRQGFDNAIARGDVDLVEELRQAQDDLAADEARAELARAEAVEIQASLDEDLASLAVVRQQQEALGQELTLRLVAEEDRQRELAAQDADLANQISAEEERIRKELEARQAAAGGGSSSDRGPIPDASEIIKVRGFWVHQSIESNVAALIDAAAADGINFGGGGWRSSASQIRLRKAHCGSSEYAIWEMPSSQCRPPTARPGRSMHERGLAIDFTYNGRIIGSRNNDGYRWLAANAASFGLYNLPSEPWHWSTNGN